jgi:carboxypeptidase Taq
VYAPKVLLDKSLNEGYNPDYFVTYIETKYLGLTSPAYLV